MGSAAGGASVLLAALLGVAGVIKLRRPAAAAAAVRKLIPHRFRSAPPSVARLLGAAEVATAVGLVAASGPLLRAVGAWTVVLGAGFTVAVEVAIRKGTSCGCWGSLSNGPAGGAETARAAGVAVLGALVVLGASRSREWGEPAPWLWALVLGAAWFAAAAAGARLRPTPSKRPHAPVSLARGFVLGPGGIDERPPDHPAAVFGRDRRRDLRRLRRHPTVAAALDRADGAGGVGWRDALVIHPRSADSEGNGARVVVARGPAGQLRIVENSQGEIALQGRIADATVVGSDAGLAVLP